MFANLQSSCALVLEEDAEDLHLPSGPARKSVLSFQVPDRAVIRLPNRARSAVDIGMIEDAVAPSIDSRAIPSPTRSAYRRGFSAKVPEVPAVREVYQSISCMSGLRESSFEELRLECYKQSMIATGQPPQPVIEGAEWRTLLAPAFVPFVDQGEKHARDLPASFENHETYLATKEVIMSLEPLIASAFTFSLDSRAAPRQDTVLPMTATAAVAVTA